ncbi:DUF2637 domain-containing protein [Microbispora rosea]
MAAIAAVVSFRHMHELCLRHGEDHLAAVLIPLAVDGLIVVAPMSILLANRYGSRGGLLAWSLLAVGSFASLGANIAVAEPSLESTEAARSLANTRRRMRALSLSAIYTSPKVTERLGWGGRFSACHGRRSALWAPTLGERRRYGWLVRFELRECLTLARPSA